MGVVQRAMPTARAAKARGAPASSPGPTTIAATNGHHDDSRPLFFDVQGAARQLCLSVRRVRSLIDTGELQARRHGRKVLILDEELKRYAASLPTRHVRTAIDNRDRPA